MLYKYDKKGLLFRPVSRLRYIDVRLFLLGIVTVGLLAVTNTKSRPSIEDITYEERVLVIKELTSFSEEKLIAEIKKLNFRYPHIVLAQAKLESSNYSSTIFKENNNLFGMKEAKVRLNTAQGTERSHAYYDTWRESLMDYALYSATYLKNLTTETQYYSYLEQNYAEDVEYVSKLKRIIETQELKKVFK